MGLNSSQYLYRTNGVLATYGDVLSEARAQYAIIRDAHAEMMRLTIRDIDKDSFLADFRVRADIVETAARRIAEMYFGLGDVFDQSALANMIVNIANEVSDANAIAFRESRFAS